MTITLDLTDTMQRLIDAQHAERVRLGETTDAITEALKHIPDAPIPSSLTGAAARLLWYQRRAPVQMIDDMRRVAVSPLRKVRHEVGCTLLGHVVLVRNWTYEFGAAVDLRVFTRHGPATLVWMTSSPLRLGNTEQVFPPIQYSGRSRPVGKITHVGNDPLVQRMREAGMLPSYRSHSTSTTHWNSTMGWDCTDDDPTTTGTKIQKILSELASSFAKLTTTPR